MHRRSLLALVGAGTLAGCAGVPSGEPGDAAASSTADGPGDETVDGPREVPMGTPVDPEHGPGPIAFADARVRASVFAWDIFYTLHTRERGQYIVVDVSVGDERAGNEPSGDAQFHPRAYATRLVADGEEYRPDEALSGRGRLVFPVPATAADRAAVRVRVGGETVSWVLDDDTTAALASIPEFVVRDARVVVERGRAAGGDADSAADDDGVALAVTVANEGDRDGEFRGLVCAANRADACRPLSFAVPAGEAATRRHALGTFDDPGRVALVGEVSAETRRFRYGGE